MPRSVQTPRATRRHLGFTLIELMIVMLVVALLAAWAMPNFSEATARSRRNEAKAVMAQAAQWIERYRAENQGSYVGATLPPGLNRSPMSGGTAHYTLTVSNLTATTYLLTAAPASPGPMASDVCGSFTQDATGQRTAAGGNTSGALFDRCWPR
jgi:type IV pilus assembly protein PilE